MATQFRAGDIMRALSVRHPHAARIAHGLKPVEYRTWTTAYRGPILICASKTVGDLSGLSPELRRYARETVRCAVAVIDLVGVNAIEIPRGNDIVVEYRWCLDEPRRLARPFAVTGKQSLFRVTLPETLAFVERSAA